MVAAVIREIRIYIEGGGDQRETRALLREGMGRFLSPLRDCARRKRIRWHLVLCGGRQNTFETFRRALIDYPDAFNVLLVDAEGPVAGKPWLHLKLRDGWSRPRSAADTQCHLMVQSMEAWLLADIAALTRFYGRQFNDAPLPKSNDVESIDRHAVSQALDRATRRTEKGFYHKIRHGAELLMLIDSAKVRAASRHCDRLFTTLEALMGGC